jgi:hypothetical protein
LCAPRYFSERVSPGIHDVASQKEAFKSWKEQFLHARFLKREKKIRRQQERDEQRKKVEAEKERKVHAKTRSDMIVKYFSESIGGKVHDTAAKKEAYGTWKEQ